MIETCADIRVRYAETDQMGVVYHANYLPWFESARIQMLDELGLTYSMLEAEGFMLPVLDCQLTYKQPARFDDRLKVFARVSEPPRARLKISYEVFRDETLLVTGSTSHTFINPQGQLIRPHPRFIEVFTERLRQKNLS